MNEDIYRDVLVNLLVGDLDSEDKLSTVLKFLDNVKTLTHHLYWDKRFKQDMEKDQKFLGDLGSE
jgi:hypothetical protein